MIKRKGVLLGVLCGVLICLLTACRKDTWSEKTYQNLDLIHAHILTEAPGPVDPQNPNFMQNMSVHYQNAVRLARRVRHYGGYYAVLQYFVNSFHDTNIRLENFNFPEPVFYPGFILSYNGARAFVSKAGHLRRSNVPPVGARFLDCHGDTLAMFMQKNVFPYYGNAKLQASWYLAVPRMFVKIQNPFVEWPKVCRFEVNGQVKRYRLKWHDTSGANLRRFFALASFRYQPKFTIKQISPALVWINWPTFMPKSNEELLWMKKILRRLPSLRDDQVVTIDVRGNRGGNLDWGKLLLERLYGKTYFDWVLAQHPAFFRQYRVSEYAIKAARQKSEKIRRVFGPSSREYEDAQKTLTDLRAAFERGDQLYPHRAPAYIRQTTEVIPAPLYSGKLIIVTDGRCNNMCLNFIAIAKAFPSVEIYGKQTNADTYYTQSRQPIFLAGDVSLHFGYAIERHRGRGSNEPYYPNKRYPHDINNTAALEAWLKNSA